MVLDEFEFCRRAFVSDRMPTSITYTEAKFKSPIRPIRPIRPLPPLIVPWMHSTPSSVLPLQTLIQP